MNVRYVLTNQLDTLSFKYTGYEFNLGAKICISSVFESGVDRVARLSSRNINTERR